MTKGTRVCWAEAVFESRGRLWKSSYRVTRSSKKGTLQKTGELAELVNGEWVPRTDKLDEWREKTAEAIGLRFQEFLRCVLLAQGSFAEFLRAKGDDRAVILEGITGTEIYKDISRQVHAEKRAREKALEEAEAQVQGIRLLSAEDLKALRVRLAGFEEREEVAEKEAARLDEALSWLHKKADLTHEHEESNKSLEDAREADKRFAENRQRLDLARKAREFEPQLAAIKGNNDALSETLQKLKSYQESAKAKTLLLEELSARATEAEQRVSEARAASEQLEAVAPRVQALDEERAVLKEKRDAASAAVQKALGIKTGREEELSRLASDLKRSEADAEAAALRVEKPRRTMCCWKASPECVSSPARCVSPTSALKPLILNSSGHPRLSRPRQTRCVKLTDRRKKAALSCRRSAGKPLRRNSSRMLPGAVSRSPGRLPR